MRNFLKSIKAYASKRNRKKILIHILKNPNVDPRDAVYIADSCISYINRGQ